jgi:hypothetical protein
MVLENPIKISAQLQDCIQLCLQKRDAVHQLLLVHIYFIYLDRHKVEYKLELLNTECLVNNLPCKKLGPKKLIQCATDLTEEDADGT